MCVCKKTLFVGFNIINLFLQHWLKNNLFFTIYFIFYPTEIMIGLACDAVLTSTKFRLDSLTHFECL